MTIEREQQINLFVVDSRYGHKSICVKHVKDRELERIKEKREK